MIEYGSKKKGVCECEFCGGASVSRKSARQDAKKAVKDALDEPAQDELTWENTMLTYWWLQ